MPRTLRPLLLWVWFIIITAPAFGQRLVPLRTAGERPVDIQHIRLDLRVDLRTETIEAKASLRLRSLQALTKIRLDAVGFQVKSVRISMDKQADLPARFDQDGKDLLIQLEPAWPAGQTATLAIDYRIHEPKDGLHFFAPNASEPDVPLTVWSLGEPVSNRYWIPCLDQPNQRQTTEMVVTVAEGNEVLSNGRLIERHANPADKTVTFHWLQDKPHPSYLITLVVGPFEIVRDEWDHMPVMYYVPRGRKADAVRSFAHTPEMLEYFSKRFGVRYPWDKYAQVVAERFDGGMEHTSATTLGLEALHDERALLDHSPDELIAHELAHQWWGDLVTCRSWSHLWLNEGFASYAEALWEEHSHGADAYAYDIYLKSRPAISGARDRPVVDRRYPNPDSMFDSRAYPKGALLLHMLRQRLGDDAFWHCIQAYAKAYRYQSIETSDFRKILERETGHDLERFFYDWTERAGSPNLEVVTRYVPEKKQARVQVKQTQSGEAFEFPLAFVFYGAAFAKPMRSEKNITNKDQTFYFTLPGEPQLVDVDPHQAVLADIKEDKSRELWTAQLQQSSSVAGRIRAAQHFAQSKTPADLELVAQALATEKFWGVQVEIVKFLSETKDDIGRDALIAGLGHPHPKVRRACAQRLRRFGRDSQVATALRQLLQGDEPSYFVAASALESYTQLHQPDTVAVLTPWLARSSYLEIIQEAALNGIVEAQDLSALDTLLDWSRKGEPRASREKAMKALAILGKSSRLSKDQAERVVVALLASLQGESVGIRRSALSALREMGAAAATALPILERLARDEKDERSRTIARRAAEKIRATLAAPANQGGGGNESGGG